MRSTLGALTLVLVAALTGACSEAEQNTGNNGGNGGSGGATDSAPTGGGGADTGGSDTGGSDTGGTTGGGGGPCGENSGGVCDPTWYCDYIEDTCGKSGGDGSCEPKPEVCSDVVEPVCGCDGKVYGNACEAAAAGIDLQSLGGCPSPPGAFPCGALLCSKADELCQIDLPDVPGDPTVYTCLALPPNCMVPELTCACLADMKCGQSCMLADGSFTLTCSGG